ncbi:aspartate dehydrogenase [Bordetella sp. H567]|uniref:aspartate dehydrogenase n=1 Tax=Bordetella sp. H567 TaxID=1697043 RepID=UPI00081CB49E|nr:aspartate dehydrogenase [Bordetella sp. H567]AOB33739.1 aspartate dehydrogenase [Bordetella sp. H567]
MGGHVHRALEGDKHVRITHVVVPPDKVAATQTRLDGKATVTDRMDGIEDQVDFALECAGHQAVAETVPQLLMRGVDVIIASVGALSRAGLAESLEAAALRGGAQLALVPGAVAGVDALAAARQQGLQSVEYTGRKSPVGWRGTPAEMALDLDALTVATAFFEGSAREAAALYPKNANVAAMVGLAGIGLDRTRVTLIADPAAVLNNHRIVARGEFGELDVRTAGATLADNPKTSMLAALSIVRAVRNRVAGIVI